MRIAIPTSDRDDWDAKIVSTVQQGATTYHEICAKLDVVPKTYDGVVVMRRLQALRKSGQLQYRNDVWALPRRRS